MNETPRSNLRKPFRLVPWVPIAAVLLAGGYLVYRLARRGETTAQHAGEVASAPADTALPASTASPAQIPSPNPGAAPQHATPADALSLLQGVSGDARLRAWLAGKDLVHLWAVVTDNVAQGVSPGNALRFLAPRTPFTVARREHGLVIAPESYARYDTLAEMVRSVDSASLVRAYRRLHPILEGAYRMLGYPAGSLDRATVQALRRVEEAPVALVKPEVRDDGGMYAFADRRLEQLPDLEKQLLRMGPRNQTTLQTKAREILEALARPVPAATR